MGDLVVLTCTLCQSKIATVGGSNLVQENLGSMASGEHSPSTHVSDGLKPQTKKCIGDHLGNFHRW